VLVVYDTANGTATAGSDYTAKSGTLTFVAGETTKTIDVLIAGDTFGRSRRDVRGALDVGQRRDDRNPASNRHDRERRSATCG